MYGVPIYYLFISYGYPKPLKDLTFSTIKVVALPPGRSKANLYEVIMTSLQELHVKWSY